MELVQVMYIGVKPLKEDNVAGTGAVWRGEGDVQAVPLAAWPKLAVHSGVWRLAEGGQTLASAPAAKPQATAPAPAPTPAPAQPAAAILYGADLPALIDVGGTEYQLGAIVAATQGQSGLTAEQWNALLDSERQERVEAFIAQARGEAAQGQASTTAAQVNAKQAESVQADAPLTHEQLKAELTRMGVAFKGNASRATLQVLYDQHKAKG